MSPTLTPGSPPTTDNGASVRSPAGPPPPNGSGAVRRCGTARRKNLSSGARWRRDLRGARDVDHRPVVSAGKSDSSAANAVSKPAAAPAATATPVATPAARISVSLREFKVTPSATVGKAGRITFKVSNAGQITHEFVVLRTTHPAAALPFKGGRADEAGNVGETGDLVAGQTKAIALKLKPGHYALVCNLPGHYKAGQHTDFTVK